MGFILSMPIVEKTDQVVWKMKCKSQKKNEMGDEKSSLPADTIKTTASVYPIPGNDHNSRRAADI